MAQHKTAVAVISALVVLGVGLSVWASTDLLPYSANVIPAPRLPPFSRCQPPMWLQTQSRLAERLGDCPCQVSRHSWWLRARSSRPTQPKISALIHGAFQRLERIHGISGPDGPARAS